MRIISAYANAFLTHICACLKFLTSVKTLMLTFEEIAKKDDLSIFDNSTIDIVPRNKAYYKILSEVEFLCAPK